MSAAGRLDSVSMTRYLLDLHERSNELGYRELQRRALEKLTALIPFDSGLLGLGTIESGVATGRDVVLHRQPPEFMASWDQVRHEDRVASWAFAHPNQTGNFPVDGPVYSESPAIVVHCRDWGLAHILCTAVVAQDMGLYWVLSQYRANPAQPFSEEERAATEMLVPHLVSAARRARIGQLRARSRVTDTHGQAALVANQQGTVLEAEPGLTELLRAQWPGWVGPLLPRELAALAQRPTARREVLGRLAFRADAADGVVLMHVRRSVPADQLTAREREIAEAFSRGETYLELSASHGVAPNTVRRHLSNIYEKLGISSKAELEKMIRDE